MLRLFKTLQRKWLSHISEWYDCGVKNTDTLHGSKDTSKSNTGWFFQCVLPLPSSMFVPTQHIIHTTIINASYRHQTVSSSWTYIVFASMWHKHIRYIANNRKKLILNTNIFCWTFGHTNCESLYFIGFAINFKMFIMHHGILYHVTVLLTSNFLNLRRIKILWLNEELLKQ